MLKRLIEWAYKDELLDLKEHVLDTCNALEFLNKDLEEQNQKLRHQMLDYKLLKAYVDDDDAILELLDAEKKREEAERTTNASADYWKKRAESAENELMTWSDRRSNIARQLGAMGQQQAHNALLGQQQAMAMTQADAIEVQRRMSAACNARSQFGDMTGLAANAWRI